MRLHITIVIGVLGLIKTSNAQPVASPSSSASDLADLPATQILELLASRTITATDYVEDLIQRYETGGFACKNGFIHFNKTQILADAMAIDMKAEAGQDTGPLHGLPLAVKNVIDVVGFPTTAATPALEFAYPTVNAPLIQAYLDANGIILGTTNLAEMQATLTSINPTNGWVTTPLNAYDSLRIAGGSSGGSAAVVANRLAPFALCEDTAGSCRAPAIANGIYGLRPSLGSYNVSDNVVPAFFTRDTIGSFGRTVDDVILLDSIVRKPNCTTTSIGALSEPVSCEVEVERDLDLTGIRLGLPSTFGWAAGLSSEIAGTIQIALDKLKAAGVELVPFDSAPLEEVGASAWQGTRKSSAYETSDTTARYLYRHNSTLSLPELYYKINRPDTRDFYTSTLFVTQNQINGNDENWVDYLKNSRPNTTKFWIDFLEQNNFDALLYPGFRTEISKIDSGDNYQIFTNSSGTFLLPYYDLTYFELDAQAGMTVGAFPVGMSTTGTPVGLQVGATTGKDDLILSLMLAFENLLDPMPAPPKVADCSGCKANITNYTPNYTGNGQPNATSVWTNFALTFGGQCQNTTLTSYGRSGPLGVGAVRNYTGPINTVQGTTLASAG